jgi:hypothetical protein
MATIVKVDTIPAKAPPVEGVDYNVLVGTPQQGDKVRITTNSGCVIFESCYTPVTAPSGPQPKVLAWAELATWLISLLGGGATGRAALGSIIKNCQSSVQGADNFFALYFAGQTAFTKVEFTGVLADVSTSIVSGTQKTAVNNNWPVG